MLSIVRFGTQPQKPLSKQEPKQQEQPAEKPKETEKKGPPPPKRGHDNPGHG
jgi:hypothetical protein